MAEPDLNEALPFRHWCASLALAHGIETRRMVRSPLMPGGASVDEKTVDELLRAGVGTVVQEISIITLDQEIAAAALPVPDFVKIDFEGWEIEALRGAKYTGVA